MDIIARGRQAGKTYEAVQWVLEGEQTDSYPGWTRVILAHNIHEADRIREDYPALDYRQVFGIEEMRNARFGPKPVEIAVDNADMVLQRLLGRSVALATTTGAAR